MIDIELIKQYYEFRDDGIYRDGKKRQTFLNNCGYPIVNISIFGKTKCYSAHKLMWLAHNGPVPKGLEIDHIDGDKENFSISNLQLLTHKENCRKSYALRRQRAYLLLADISAELI